MAAEKTFLTTFFKRLDINHVRYAVARKWESLPESLDGSDLDIATPDERSLLAVVDAARNAATECGGGVVSFYRVEGVAICLGGRLTDGQWWGCHIDVFTGFRFRGFEYIDDTEVWNTLVREKETFWRCGRFVGTIAFFKELLANGHDDKRYLRLARAEYQSDGVAVIDALCARFGAQTRGDLCALLSSDAPDVDLGDLSSRFNAMLRREFVKRYGFLTFAAMRIRNVWRRALRLFNPAGFCVAFLGTDGSGKSTLIESVKPHIEQMLHAPVHYEHLRPNLIPSIARLMGMPVKQGPTTDPHGGKVSGWFGSFVRFAYYYIDYTVGYWVKIRPILAKRSQMVVFDRYYYEYMIDPRRCAVRLPRGWARFWGWFIPKPDLILCLGGSPEKIYARKPETSLEEVRRQVVALKKFCNGNSRAVWIETTTSIEASRDAALDAIVNQMSKRYKRT